MSTQLIISRDDSSNNSSSKARSGLDCKEGERRKGMIVYQSYHWVKEN